MGRPGFITQNSGYIGYSMSKRAAEAYSNGEMPKSKWTKTAIMERLEEMLGDMIDDEDDLSKVMAEFKKKSQKALFEGCFVMTSWHHVGGFATPVNFYNATRNKLENFVEHNSDSMPESVRVLGVDISWIPAWKARCEERAAEAREFFESVTEVHEYVDAEGKTMYGFEYVRNGELQANHGHWTRRHAVECRDWMIKCHNEWLKK